LALTTPPSKPADTPAPGPFRRLVEFCCQPQPSLDALGRCRSRILAAFLLVSIAVFGFVDSVYVLTVPSMLALVGPFSITALGAGLSLVFMHHRDRVERDRQIELQANIRELEMKNTELERFTYTVSHDLKGPLVTIRGFLGYATRHAEAGRAEPLREDVARIEAATERMQLLLDELLRLSRIGRFANPPTDLELGVAAAEALLRGRLDAGHVEVEIA